MYRLKSLLITSLFSLALYSQGETDAFKYSQLDIKGSARAMGMAGAFGSLGGDPYSLSHNPAGIAVSSRSEVSSQLNLRTSSGNTNFSFDNLGYLGTFDLPNGRINFGVSYNRLKNYSRTFSGGLKGGNNTLLHNVTAEMNNSGITPQQIIDTKDPYWNWGNWLGIASFDSYLINAENYNSSNTYLPALENVQKNDLRMSESGYLNEYSFGVGGTLNNEMIYWGLSVGVTDLNYRLSSAYHEEFGNGNYTLNNTLTTRGTGYNVKLGLIVRPTDELRIGAYFHSPTWFAKNIDNFSSNIDYLVNDGENTYKDHYSKIPTDYSTYKMNSPIKFGVSASYVLGKMAIVSVEYEGTDYSQMRLNDLNGYSFSDNDYIREDFQYQNTIKAGLELRLGKNFSLRGGYAHQSSPIKANVLSGNVGIPTAGTIPHYSLINSTNYITGGVGFRISSFYIDAAYVHRTVDEDVWFNTNLLDSSSRPLYSSNVVKNKYNTGEILLSIGIRF